MVLWVNMGLAFFCGDTGKLEISERGLGGIGGVVGHL